MKKKKTKQQSNNVLAFVIIVIGLMVVYFVIKWGFNSQQSDDLSSFSAQASEYSNAINIADVQKGTAVYVQFLKLSQAASVHIYKQNEFGETSIGQSSVYTPGIYGNIAIQISNITDGEAVRVVLEGENGSPIVDSYNQPIEIIKPVGMLPMEVE